MWILVNALQIVVFVGMWKINYSPLCKSTLEMLKTIILGEYLKDLDIGAKIQETLGIETQNDDDEQGLASGNIVQNLGVTFFVVIGLVITLSLCCLGCSVCVKKYNLNASLQEFFQKVKSRLFFNPFIRLTLLNHLKFVVSACLAYTQSQDDVTAQIAAIVAFSLVNLLSVAYAVLIYRKRHELGDERTRAAYGSLYIGI